MTKSVIVLGSLEILIAGAFLFFLGILEANAEPYIATRTGFKCSQCHVNRTGGGMRTDFGVVYSQVNLPMALLQPSGEPSFLDGKLSDVLSLGADFRASNVSVFRYEGPPGVEGEPSNRTRISEANFYLRINLIPEVFTLYADQTLTPSSSNREIFGLLQDPAGNVYLKIGRMLLPYGWRLLDDDAFVRNRTGHTYDRHDLGVEVGFEPSLFSVMTNLTDTRLSVVGSMVLRRFRLGGSYARVTNHGEESSWGAFGGVNFGHVTLLGEFDLITEASIDRFASLVELDVLIVRGFNCKIVYEFFDRNMDIANDRDGQERITLGVEPFVAQFLQFGLFYRINRFIPQAVTENQDQLLVQFHAFY